MSWVPLTKENTRETQREIERVIGLTRRTFRASAFLAQGDSAAFPDADPSERKAIVGEAIDPTALWPRWAARAREEAKQAEGQTLRLAGAIGIRNDQLAHLPEVRAAWGEAQQAKERCGLVVSEAERTLEAALAEQAANAAAAERVKTATVARDAAAGAHDRAARALERARAAANELPGARMHLAKIEAERDRVPELERRYDAQLRAVAERDTLIERKRTIEARAEELAGKSKSAGDQARDLDRRQTELAEQAARIDQAPEGDEKCDRCQQTLGGEARTIALESLRREIADLGGKITALVDEAHARAQDALDAKGEASAIEIPIVGVDDLETPLHLARAAAGGIPAAEQNIRALEQQADEIPDAEIGLADAKTALEVADREVAAAAEGVKDTQMLSDAVDAARRAVTTGRLDLDEANEDAARLAQRLEQLDQAGREVVDLNAELDQAQEQLDILRVGQQAFGRDGVPTLIAENIIPTLEASANQVLARMPLQTGTVLRVELHTQAELKDGRLAETLDIVVHDRDTSRRFETFSGGERFRVSFALRWALATLLANRRGAESKLLAVDEPDGLDATGMDGLVSVITAAGVPFEKVLIVSHQERLASSFDRTIEVQTDGDRSWVGAQQASVAV